MKRRKQHQLIPTIIMAGAAAVPVATTVEILTHVPGHGSTIALQPSQPVAARPTGPSSSGAGLPASTSGGTHTYQGPTVNDPFGGVQATVVVAGKKIADVTIAAPQNNPSSASINQQAVPLLRSETLQAQSAQINTISGATYTSQAYAQSLQGALDQARSQGNALPSASQPSNGTSSGTAQASISVSGDD